MADPAPSRAAAADRRRRRAVEAARALLVYGLLIGGTVVFALPFVWMVGTSLKVDREMFGDKITLFPMRPVPADHSPYLDDRLYPEPDDPVYQRLRDNLIARIAAAGLPGAGGGGDGPAGVLAPGVYRRLRLTLPVEVWRGADDDIRQRVLEAVTPALVGEVLAQVQRQLLLGAVRVRSFDLQEAELTQGQRLSAFWSVEGTGQARLVDRADTRTEQAVLQYDFRDQPGRGELRLSRTLELPFPADRLYRLQVSIRPDDSWHPVEFLVERNGRQYRGLRPEYMGDFQWTVVSLQEYGPDDRSDSNKIRLWLPYREIDGGPQYESGENRVKVTLVLRQTSALGAWWGKAQKNYRGALQYIPFWRYAGTSAFLVVLNVLGNIFSCSLVAYAFARLQWPGRDLGFGLMLATLMIPPQVTMIPYFLIIRHLGWYGTLKPLWVLSFFGNAFNIFLLRQFMKGIPRDLEDAARIDGCHPLQVYWHVIMPLIKPTLACIAIFTFMAVWNDFMGPLIYLGDQRLYPLSLGLYAFNVQAGGNFGMMMAGSLLMTLPVIAVFFFAQKYFIQGITLTGLKG